MRNATTICKRVSGELHPDDHVAEDGAVRLTGLSKYTLRNDRHLGKGPPYVRIGRAIRYRVGDLLDFMAAHKVHPGKAE